MDLKDQFVAGHGCVGFVPIFSVSTEKHGRKGPE